MQLVPTSCRLPRLLPRDGFDERSLSTGRRRSASLPPCRVRRHEPGLGLVEPHEQLCAEKPSLLAIGLMERVDRGRCAMREQCRLLAVKRRRGRPTTRLRPSRFPPSAWSWLPPSSLDPAPDGNLVGGSSVGFPAPLEGSGRTSPARNCAAPPGRRLPDRSPAHCAMPACDARSAR